MGSALNKYLERYTQKNYINITRNVREWYGKVISEKKNLKCIETKTCIKFKNEMNGI